MFPCLDRDITLTRRSHVAIGDESIRSFIRTGIPLPILLDRSGARRPALCRPAPTAPSAPTSTGPGRRRGVPRRCRTPECCPRSANRAVPPRVPPNVPNAGTAPRPGRVADEAFVRALYAEHGGALLRYALHLTGGDRQRAEDLVQETIVRAWRHPEALTDRPARPWLFAVARNLADVDAS